MRENLFKFCSLPAVVNFKDQHATNLNYFFEYQKDESFIKIEPLTPLVMLHPLTEREIEIKNHLVSKHEYDHIRTGIRNFFFLRNTQDGLLKDNKKVSSYLQEVADQVNDTLNKSNFYNQIISSYKSSGVYGTSAMIEEEDVEDLEAEVGVGLVQDNALDEGQAAPNADHGDYGDLPGRFAGRDVEVPGFADDGERGI
jgi:hypothetical protein